jgi:hypothetical protein
MGRPQHQHVHRFDKCIVKANDRAAVATCISNFANDVRR